MNDRPSWSWQQLPPAPPNPPVQPWPPTPPAHFTMRRATPGWVWPVVGLAVFVTVVLAATAAFVATRDPALQPVEVTSDVRPTTTTTVVVPPEPVLDSGDDSFDALDEGIADVVWDEQTASQQASVCALLTTVGPELAVDLTDSDMSYAEAVGLGRYILDTKC